jgi:MoaA/NifB/PqqE/SkfB family radical SAM enzyme
VRPEVHATAVRGPGSGARTSCRPRSACRWSSELKELGCGEVVLIGGEAYLRNDFILIIRAIREAGMSCTMTTGGSTSARSASRR